MWNACMFSCMAHLYVCVLPSHLAAVRLCVRQCAWAVCANALHSVLAHWCHSLIHSLERSETILWSDSPKLFSGYKRIHSMNQSEREREKSAVLCSQYYRILSDSMRCFLCGPYRRCQTRALLPVSLSLSAVLSGNSSAVFRVWCIGPAPSSPGLCTVHSLHLLLQLAEFNIAIAFAFEADSSTGTFTINWTGLLTM